MSSTWSRVMKQVSLSCFGVSGLNLGGEHNSTGAECLRICLVYHFISACPACGKRSGGNEEVPWGRSYSSSYTNSYNKRSRYWTCEAREFKLYSLSRPHFAVVSVSDTEEHLGVKDQILKTGLTGAVSKEHHMESNNRKKLCAQHLYISVSICVTGWKWSSVHA